MYTFYKRFYEKMGLPSPFFFFLFSFFFLFFLFFLVKRFDSFHIVFQFITNRIGFVVSF
jgi:hypothetical protein